MEFNQLCHQAELLFYGGAEDVALRGLVEYARTFHAGQRAQVSMLESLEAGLEEVTEILDLYDMQSELDTLRGGLDGGALQHAGSQLAEANSMNSWDQFDTMKNGTLNMKSGPIESIAPKQLELQITPDARSSVDTQSLMDAYPSIDEIAAQPSIDEIAAQPSIDEIAAQPSIDEIAAYPSIDEIAPRFINDKEWMASGVSYLLDTHEQTNKILREAYAGISQESALTEDGHLIPPNAAHGQGIAWIERFLAFISSAEVKENMTSTQRTQLYDESVELFQSVPMLAMMPVEPEWIQFYKLVHE